MATKCNLIRSWLSILLFTLNCGLSVELRAQPDPRNFGQAIRGLIQRRDEPRYQQRAASREMPERSRSPSTTSDQRAEQLFRTGRGYMEKGYYGEGLDALNQSLALRPGYGPALTYKGIALRNMREPRVALQYFEEALAANPNDGIAHGERGLTYYVLGEKQKAEDDLRRASQLRPDLTRWFTQQSRWFASRAGTFESPRTANPVEGRQNPPVITDTRESADSPEGQTGSDASDTAPAQRPLIDLSEAWSVFKPAATVAMILLVIAMLLRVALLIGRLLWHRTPRNRRHRQRGPAEPFRTQETFSPQESFQSQDRAEQQLTPQHKLVRTSDSLLSLNPLPTAAEPVLPARFSPSFLQHHRALLIATAAGLIVLLFLTLPALVQAFRLDPDKLTMPRERPTVLDFRGNIYTQLGTPDTPVRFADLPSHLVDALRAREDSRFFEHDGVDWFGLARALIQDLRHMRIKQGASTLTMQLVEKTYRLDQKGLLNRVRSKLVEWTMAHRAEAALANKLGNTRTAKEAIMTAYLNRVEFGDGVVGVGAASQYYFQKSVAKLTLGESCMLVALLRAPYANSPYRNPENSRLARDKIVEQMVRRGYITDEQSKQARFHVVNKPRKPRSRHNGYLVAAITREVNALKDEGKLPYDVLDHATLTIQSTLDLWAQDILDFEVRKVCSSFSGDTEDDPLGGAAIIVDNATGQVRALVSGQDYSKRQYDLVFQSRRQVASVAKPFVYGAYLEQGGSISEATPNTPLTRDEIQALNNWNPDNSSSLKVGTYPLSTGLAFSDNYITARVALNAGLRRVYDVLYLSGLVSDQATTGPTWLLGTFDCSLANVVSAYTAIPRGGTRVKPYLVRAVSIEGKEVYRAEERSLPLFNSTTCEQLHTGLREAMIDGTGRSAVRSAGLDATIAGKTGTSQNAADVWWVGYVKEVTLGVRFGRNSNTTLGKSAAGGTMAAPVATRVLKKLAERYSILNK